MASYKLLRSVPLDYRQGWDVTCTLADDSGRSQIMTFYWPREDKPDEKVLATKLQSLLDRWIAKAQEVPDEQISKQEVEALLVEKGMLKEGEKLEQLKPLSELTAEVKRNG